MRVFSMLVVQLVATVAWADPPAPSGWAHRQSDARSIYNMAARRDIELRLYPAVHEQGGLRPWLESRLARGIDGFGAVEFGDIKQNDGKTFMALGTAESARFVVALVCARGDGAKRYAELILPRDPTLIQEHLPPAARVLAQACLENPDSPLVAPHTPAQQPRVPSVATTSPAAPMKRETSRVVLGDSDIAGVLYAWDQVYQVTGLQIQEWTYLLLADGRVRDGVPEVAIEAFDPIADRRAHPNNWGRWKRNGSTLLVDFGDGFSEPPNQMARVKGQPGERLHNQYRASASANIGTTSSLAQWGLALNRDGTFRRWSSQRTGGTMLGTSALVVGDDKGSSSVVSAPGVGGGGSRSTGVTDADLEGDYYIDGWTLELRYRSGKVQRSFFYRSAEGTDIWFEGSELYVLKDD